MEDQTIYVRSAVAAAQNIVGKTTAYPIVCIETPKGEQIQLPVEAAEHLVRNIAECITHCKTEAALIQQSLDRGATIDELATHRNVSGALRAQLKPVQ